MTHINIKQTNFTFRLLMKNSDNTYHWKNFSSKHVDDAIPILIFFARNGNYSAHQKLKTLAECSLDVGKEIHVLDWKIYPDREDCYQTYFPEFGVLENVEDLKIYSEYFRDFQRKKTRPWSAKEELTFNSLLKQAKDHHSDEIEELILEEFEYLKRETSESVEAICFKLAVKFQISQESVQRHRRNALKRKKLSS